MKLVFLLILTQAVVRPKPPVDVPPIMEEYGNPGREFCDMGQCTWIDVDPSVTFPVISKPYRRARPTCADKTRFLMTSEDGVKHCIKLEGK